MNRYLKNIIALAIIVCVAINFRFINLNWDNGHHLHPDERFLNMLVNDIHLPSSFSEYLNPSLSPLNPRNHGRDFFVYGNWPVILNKLVVAKLGINGFGKIALTGRALSATADTLVVIVVFLMVWLIEYNVNQKKKKNIILPQTKIWASFVYALFVLPIQQSHFFTTDTFINFFCVTSIFFISCYFFSKGFIKPAKKKLWQLFFLVFGAIFFGLALGSKITAILFFPILFFLIVIEDFSLQKNKTIIKRIINIIGKILIFIFFTYLSFRLSSPYLFANQNILSLKIEPRFIDNLHQLKSFESDDVWFPPAIQWINQPVWFGLTNLIFFGMGLASSFFSCIGFVLLSIKCFTWLVALLKNSLLKKDNIIGQTDKMWFILLIIILWMIIFIIYYSLQFVTSIRYFLPIYPFLAILSGFGISWLIKKSPLKIVLTSLIMIVLLIWPMMFISIYLVPHSRIQASSWIYKNIPPDSIILSEHWDDALPLHLAEYQSTYQIPQLPVFGPDNIQKWSEMNSLFEQADYYILSSNRAWGSIMRVPDKYPKMSRFYQDLFDGKTEYELVAEFSSYPSFNYLGLPITFNDSWSEEAFTVYDHPEVKIFKNNKK